MDMRSPRLLYLSLFSLVSGLLEKSIVSFESTEASVPLHGASIVYSADDPVGVEIAATSLAADLEAITGTQPSLFKVGGGESIECTQCAETAIIAATVDSEVIGAIAQDGKLNVSSIDGKWESYQTSVVDNPIPGIKKALVIAGSDERGVIFGIYTLSEQCGQSPFHWWADVPATKHEEIYAIPENTTFGPPSVQYRGLFINDEAPGLTGWWSKIHGVAHQPIDTEFYKHVFDMLLRLKGNFIWPSMWKSFIYPPGNIFFTDDPGNMQLADDYGIVVSTSHHEPMQKATNEWNDTVQGPWDWEKNRDNVTAFMDDGARRAGQNESYFTLGMRGEGDGPIQADDPVAILTEVFETQREILAKYYGNAIDARQVWTIYKEVATYYAAGLIPPDDVTLMFTDDNWGNIQRLPLANETERSGGIGMYYHLEYVGVPKGYKWQNTNNLPKVYKELYQAYQRGVDRIWVINIADIKPLEMPFGFIMDLAWNTSSIDFDTIPAYLEKFATREFGSEHASEISEILMEQSRLIGRRKYESIQSKTYSVSNYHESERVLSEWQALVDKVTSIADKLPEDRKDAYWHHVQYPISSGQAYYSAMLGLGKNQQIGYERRNSANALADQVREDFDRDFEFTEKYDTIVNGKWAGILSQPHYDQYIQSADGIMWAEPTRDVITGLWYVQLRQNSSYAFGNLGISPEGGGSAQEQARSEPAAFASAPTTDMFSPVLPILDPYGKGTWTVDLFHRGDYRIPIEWEVDIPYDWIHFNPSSGALSMDQSEQRINVSIDWAAVPDGINENIGVRINYDHPPWFDLIHLPIVNYKAPDDFVGFPETSGIVSIEAPHFQRKSNGDVTFEHIPYLGTRTNSGSLALRPYKEARVSEDVAKDAWAEYDIYLYNATSSLTATVYVNGALDTDPTLLMRYSLTLSDGDNAANFTRLLEDPATPGDTPPNWATTVADHVWMRNVTLGDVGEGKHTLRWQTNSPEVYLEKIVLNTRNGMKSSYLGPPETRLLS
ncbi:hypothetical protein F5Y07DRAFT_412788 [Xylaria sp. FL0933]|nr:hypothetical protein F5Y07DRAFT_412788 [Xylaria sp. FL0933]